MKGWVEGVPNLEAVRSRRKLDERTFWLWDEKPDVSEVGRRFDDGLTPIAQIEAESPQSAAEYRAFDLLVADVVGQEYPVRLTFFVVEDDGFDPDPELPDDERGTPRVRAWWTRLASHIMAMPTVTRVPVTIRRIYTVEAD